MTNRALVRRDPQKGKKGFSNQKGFTVIELLIAVAVIAIIASLALPSYRAIIEKRQVTSAAERLTAVLSAVKSESVKWNKPMAFSASESDECVGIHQVLESLPSCSFTADAENGTCSISCAHPAGHSDYSAVDRAHFFTEFSEKDVVQSISFDGSNDMLVFDPVRGMLDTSGDEGLTVELVSTGDMYAMEVGIDRLGRIFICTKGGQYTPVPGYDTCPAQG